MGSEGEDDFGSLRESMVSNIEEFNIPSTIRIAPEKDRASMRRL